MENMVIMPAKDYKDTCEKIRELTNSSDLIKSGDLVNKINEVSKVEYDNFWNNYLKDSINEDWRYRFAGPAWDDITFNPKQDLILKGNTTNAFYYSNISNLKGILEQNGITLDTSQITNGNSLFHYSKIQNFPLIDLSNCTTVTNTFGYMSGGDITLSLKLKDDGSQNLDKLFYGAKGFVNLEIEGTIGYSGFSVQWSTNLTVESLINIMNALKDYSEDGGTYDLVLGTTNLNKLSEEQKDIARNKGWTLS